MKTTLPLALGTALVLTVTGCSKTDTNQVAESAPSTPTETEMTTTYTENNPFFVESPLYLHYPQFDNIQNSHYVPAFELGMTEHLAEIEAITNQTEAPTLDNTLVPMERSGQLLNRVATVFFAMAGANTNDELEEIRGSDPPQPGQGCIKEREQKDGSEQ